MNPIAQFWNRFKAECPPFWKKVRTVAATLLLIVSGLLADADKVGEDIAHYLRYAFVGLTTLVGAAQATVKDATEPDDKATSPTPPTPPTTA
ncbi:hypothetical protein [Hymenobacter nivis]|uniref:Holin n=1 Tax=Hymenobacter nivis TaxID=1850093 RepID=A0A2Z3GI23_9BACT|nr:hypothetical protein [Hymenobacter nivis]AWM31357.1 hypothetical protein DDQ68_00280 [Hymenobacter nivis]